MNKWGHSKQKGYVLFTVVVMLFVVAVAALLVSYDSSLKASMPAGEAEASRADYVTEAAMRHALWRTQNNACMGNVTIPTTALGADSYSATISGAAAGTAYTLTSDQDAWIRNDDVTMNNGTSASNHIKQQLGNVEQVLTRFDVSALPANARINSATAWFHLKALKDHAQGPINVHEITADWAETAVTWESFAASYRAGTIAMLPSQEAGGVWVAINLTGLVQAWVNGQPNYGILFDTQAEGIHTEYMAREDGANPPRLEVVVGTGPASPVTIQATGTLDNGVTRMLSRPITSAYQPPGTVTLQLGTDPGADAKLDDFYPRNYGGSNFVELSENTGNWLQRPILRFGLGGIPAHAAVLSAQLELRMRNLITPGAATVHRVTRSWVEGTKDGTGTADGATWATYDGTNSWTTAGGDFNAAAVAETAINGGETWVSWEIGPLVEQWLAGEPNDGLLIKGDAALREAEFYSKEEADPTLRPKLTITYACECGSPCMGPQGSGNVLMVVAEKTGLGTGDQLIKSLFEDWGYTIELISDNDNQNTFDGGFVRNDVVYVTESIESTILGTKVSAAPIGVVNGDGWMNDELGFESGNSSNWPVGNSIDITDTSHYITAPLVGGSLAIYNADMGGLAIGNTPAPDLQSLADWGTDTGLAVLESGALMANGGSAAGRRVMLPFGRDVSMDWSRLSNSGHLIMQRALQWGMNADGASSGKLLLVVGNAGSPVSKDTDRQTLFESWGYAVTLIDDGADQLKFDTETAANDVIYVSGTIIDLQLADKFTGSTTPVVNEDWDKLDDFGFADTGYNIIYDQLAVTDPLHYITEPFGGAAVIIATTGITMTTAYGTVAPDLQFVGEVIGNLPGLATLEAGAQRWDGTPAPGRRVQVPFQNAEISQLTADGVTLMKRSIEWGASASSGGCGTKIPLVLLVADINNPTSEELARKSLLESWCYSVALMTASVAQADYDELAAKFDVVYVPSSVNYADVTGKLKFQPVGVVNEVSILTAYLGFTSGTSGYTSTVIELTDNTHYITSGLTLGNLPITTTSTSLRTYVNTMGPGFKTLATRPSYTYPMIMTLETGDELLWGGNAPDRRVMLPWGGSSTFDVNNLTADGLTILQRSLEWAVGPIVSMAPIAHWKLDETSGTTAVDSEGGHHGTLPNGGAWTTGQVDGALQLDGSTNYVNVPHDDTLSLTTFSISVWMRPDTVSGFHAIMYKGASTAEANYHLYTDGDEITLGLTSGGWQYQIPTTSANLVAGQWYHLTTTFDGASGEGKHYLDGSLIHTGTIGPAPVMNTGPLTIGTDPFDEDWDGLLDDVRIYDRVLDATEIATLAAAGGGGGPPGYLDEFNSRECSAADYAGTDGSLDWSSWSWTETSESNGSCSGLIQVADDPAVADPGSFRLMLDERNRRVDRLMDLSAFTTATLSFDYRLYNYPTSADSFAVIVSGDGTNWQKLAAFTGVVSHSDYQAVSYDITPFIGTNTGIGFMTEGINTIQTAYIDNVRVFEGGGGGGGGGAGTFRDEFNAQVYSGSEGTLAWATLWLENGESDGPTKGKVGVLNDISNFQLELRDTERGVEREADLSGHSSATVTFDYRRESLDGATDYMTVEVSSNGGSTWTEIDRLVGPATDSSYQGASYDISAHIAANTRIRFLTSGSNGKNDIFYIDNVEITD